MAEPAGGARAWGSGHAIRGAPAAVGPRVTSSSTVNLPFLPCFGLMIFRADTHGSGEATPDAPVQFGTATPSWNIGSSDVVGVEVFPRSLKSFPSSLESNRKTRWSGSGRRDGPRRHRHHRDLTDALLARPACVLGARPRSPRRATSPRRPAWPGRRRPSTAGCPACRGIPRADRVPGGQQYSAIAFGEGACTAIDVDGVTVTSSCVVVAVARRPGDGRADGARATRARS